MKGYNPTKAIPSPPWHGGVAIEAEIIIERWNGCIPAGWKLEASLVDIKRAKYSDPEDVSDMFCQSVGVGELFRCSWFSISGFEIDLDAGDWIRLAEGAEKGGIEEVFLVGMLVEQYAMLIKHAEEKRNWGKRAS